MPLTDFERGRLYQFEKGKAGRRIRSNFERLTRVEAHVKDEKQERERFIEKYDGLLGLNEKQIEILNGLSIPELRALDLIPKRFRKPFITQLPILVQRDLERWEKQESPVLHNSHLQINFGIQKGGGKDIPSSGGDTSDLLGIDDRHGLFTMLDFEGKGASANEPRGQVHGLLRGYVNSVRWVSNGISHLTRGKMNLFSLLPQKSLHQLLLFMLNSTERTHDLHFPDVSAYGVAGLFQVDSRKNQVKLHYVHLGGEPLFVLRKQNNGEYKIEAHGVRGPVPESEQAENEEWTKPTGDRNFGNELYNSWTGQLDLPVPTPYDLLEVLNKVRNRDPDRPLPMITSKDLFAMSRLKDGDALKLNPYFRIQCKDKKFALISEQPRPFTRVETLNLGVGDKVVSFTDGLTEALDSGGERFGHHRILSILRHNAYLSAEELTDVLKAAREAHIAKNIEENNYMPDDMRIRVFEVVRKDPQSGGQLSWTMRLKKFMERFKTSWKQKHSA